MKKLKFISTFALTLVVGLMFVSTTLAQNAKVVEMEGLNNFKYSVTEITASPGQKITVKLTTKSELPAIAMSHNFVLLKANADASKVALVSASARKNDYIAPDMKDKIIAYTDMAGGGETVTVTFTAPEKPGEYTYICTFPGHFQGGMKGTLIVK